MAAVASLAGAAGGVARVAIAAIMATTNRMSAIGRLAGEPGTPTGMAARPAPVNTTMSPTLIARIASRSRRRRATRSARQVFTVCTAAARASARLTSARPRPPALAKVGQ